MTVLIVYARAEKTALEPTGRYVTRDANLFPEFKATWEGRAGMWLRNMLIRFSHADTAYGVCNLSGLHTHFRSVHYEHEDGAAALPTGKGRFRD